MGKVYNIQIQEREKQTFNSKKNENVTDEG